MSKKSKPTSARDARLAQARQEQQSKERRRTFLLVGSTALVIVAILAMVGYAIVSESEEREAAGNLAAVKEYEEGTIFACGFDPGQNDETALAAVELNSVSGRDTVLEAYAKRGQTPEWWACLFLGCDPDDPALAVETLRQ